MKVLHPEVGVPGRRLQGSREEMTTLAAAYNIATGYMHARQSAEVDMDTGGHALATAIKGASLAVETALAGHEGDGELNVSFPNIHRDDAHERAIGIAVGELSVLSACTGQELPLLQPMQQLEQQIKVGN